MSIKFDDLFDDDSGIFEQEEVKETVQPEEDLTKDSKEEIDDVDVEKEVKEIVDFESNDEDLFGNDDEEATCGTIDARAHIQYHAYAFGI